MDIQINTTPSTKKTWQIAVGVSVILSLVIWLLVNPKAQASLDAAQAWSATVQKGDLAITVSGYGQLKSKKPRLITAMSNATVEELLLRPGSEVAPDSVIMRLQDAALTQSLKDAERALKQSQDQYAQTQINQKLAVLALQSDLEILKADLESAELEVEAQGKLVGQGVVSRLDYQRAVLQHRQLKRRIDIEQNRITELSTLHQANLQLAQSNIDSRQEALELVQDRVDKLTVTAGIYGVLQQLDVELGQSVNSGTQLALVGSSTDLYAQVQVPQTYAQQLKVDQAVTIDTRKDNINGTIVRINPMVSNGNIEVEVALREPLPSSARPELSIAAQIHIEQRQSVLYIEKPIGAKPFSTGLLFRLDESGQQAQAITVEFGAETTQYIELVAGAEQNQRFILSDTSRYQTESVIQITH
ncbi:efflux RND transporter periplasmic adaptor subunit [Pseudoalteromonas sp. T1lg65]|uniref:efflux RND transporter periplasmic adaptor subunit n=1 Tax=Pseudoalteromonas sp. T1lg65 TaxID=2077101 RepID=UPI003F793881